MNNRFLPLSMLDAQFVGADSFKLVFYYRKSFDIDHVYRSFRKVLQDFDILSSRLVRADTGDFLIQQTKTGALFVIQPAIKNKDINQIDLDINEEIAVKVEALPGRPMLIVTVTPIDSGVILGLSYSHIIADGYTLDMFCSAWEAVAQGKTYKMPSKQRSYKHGFSENQIMRKGMQINVNHHLASPRNSEKYHYREINVTKEFISSIHEKAQDQGKLISEFQIVNAYLLKEYSQKILPGKDIVTVKNPVQIRKLHPDIDEGYVGNAFVDSITVFQGNEIENKSLIDIAVKIKNSIRQTKNCEYIKRVVTVQGSEIIINTELLMNSKYFEADPNRDIMITSLLDFSSKRNGWDFGTGKPCRTGKFQTVGPNMFLLMRNNDGNINVSITSLSF